jgi:hypothetical protein
MQPYKVKSVQYVVIKTGYTARLWNEADSDGNATIKSDCIFMTELSHTLKEWYGYDPYDPDDPDDENDKWMIKPLFAYDKNQGTGLYKIKNSKEADTIIGILKEVDKFDSGIMCFKFDGSQFNVLNTILMNNNYGYCCIYNCDYMEMIGRDKSDQCILYMSYLSESE